MKYFIILFLVLSIQVSAQISPDFNLPTGVCLEEQFQIENTSVNADSYEWDFCFEEFSTLTPSFESFSNSGLALPFEARIIEADTSSFLFVPNRNNNSIKRYHVSSDFEAIYAESSIQNVSTFFQEPISLDVVRLDDNWVGYGVDFAQSKIYSLDFGGDLSADPSIQELPLNNISLNNPSRIKIETNQDSVFLFVSNFGTAKLSKIVIDKANINLPISEDEYAIAGANQLASFDILNFSPNQWIMLLGQAGGNNLIKLKFANSLNAYPSIENLPITGDTFTKPSGPQLFKEGDKYYSLLVNRLGEFFLLDFGTNINNTPNVTNYGITTGSNASWSLDVVKNDNSRFVGFFTRFNSNLAIKLSFDDICNAIPVYSTNEEPIVKFSSSGTKSINLNAYNSFDEVATTSKSIEVNTSTAPTGQININSAYCLLDDINFTFNTSDNINSYLWNFGDGNNSMASNPTYQYASDGEYFITLEVENTDGCTNIFYDTLVILPEPQPEFSTASTEYCTFETIDFSNLTPFDFGENVEWSWDFNGEGVSSLKNPEFTFEMSGTKTITLEATVLGCVSTYQSTLEIIDGPLPNFSYDYNCLNETIQFTNLSTGTTITGYNWDFGNGQTSTIENPQTTYINSGIYTVTLEVSNASGCATSTSQAIQIYDQIIDSIKATQAIQNLPFRLGVDWLNSYDSTQNITYQWELNGEIQTTDTATYNLSEGIYIIDLTVTTANNCVFTKQRTIEVSVADEPTVDFNLPALVCLEERFQIENTSVNADSYEWDFCFEEFFTLTPSFEPYINQGLSTPFETRIIEADTSFYLFIPNRASNSIQKYHVSSDFEAIYAQSSIQNVSTFFQEPISIDVVRVDDNWIGYAVDFTQSKIYSLNFGDDLNADPSIQELPLTNISLNNPSRIKIETNQDSVFLFVSNFGTAKLSKIVIDKANINLPISEDEYVIPGANQLASFDILEFSPNEWIMLLGQVGGNNLIKLQFTSSLNADPSIENLSITGNTFVRPSGPQLFKEGDNYYSLLVNRAGEFFRLDFGNDINNIPNVTNYGITTGSNASWSLDVIKNNNSRFIGFFTDFNLDDVIKIMFDDDCSLDQAISYSASPILNFNSSGTYPITLTAYHPNGNSASLTKEITVTSDVAPEINTLIANSERCIGSTINFEANSPDDISNWLWTFGNGDSANVQNPSYIFDTPGTYEVVVEGESINGCTNRRVETIEIYEPPTVTFSGSSKGALCSQKPIQFTNTSSLLTEASFVWDFGDGNTSVEENPEHIYAEAGTYEVALVIEMAGCTSSLTQSVEVNPGPNVNFVEASNCFGQVIEFNNISSGEFITGYSWNFGDGSSSTQQNPVHSYDTPGIKTVELTAFTTNGCNYTITEEIEVFPLADVNFTVDPACEDTEVQFNEDISLNNANVADYLWDFGVTGISSDISNLANPLYAYEEAGTYEVRLQVTTEDGCTTFETKTITVSESPEPSINFAPSCLGEEFIFSGNDNNNIENHFWSLKTIEGDELTTSTSPSLTYTFSESGNYIVSYRQETEQLCSKTVEEEITILAPPTVAFTVQNQCVGSPIQLTNNSTLNGNQVSSYKWFLDDELFSTEENPMLTTEDAGSVEIRLEVETETACMVSTSQTINIANSPNPIFNLSSPIVAVPYDLNLSASLNSGESAKWYLNDELISESANLVQTIDSVGLYFVSLEISNEQGCTETMNKQLSARKPELNIALNNIQAIEGNGFTEFILTLSNKGSLVPDYYNLSLNFGEYSVTERLETEILPEKLKNERLSVQLSPEQLLGVDRVCVEAVAVKGAFEESNTADNRSCINITSAFNVLPLYPNPSKNNITIPIIIPQSASVEFLIEQSDGKTAKQFNRPLEAGYNEITLSKDDLKEGIYFVRIRYNQNEVVRKVVFY